MDIQYLVHFGYLVMLAGFLARDMLQLRSFLFVAQVCVSAYAWIRGVHEIAVWNGIFAAINAAWTAKLILQRRAVRLPDELVDLHERYFSALTAPELMRFWKLGTRWTVIDEALTREGQRPEWLYFILQGEAVIRQRGRDIVKLGAGSFIAEMSLLTGEPATADAANLGRTLVMRWPVQQLLDIRARNPAFWGKIQSVLGRDLVAKIQRSASPLPDVPVAPLIA